MRKILLVVSFLVGSLMSAMDSNNESDLHCKRARYSPLDRIKSLDLVEYVRQQASPEQPALGRSEGVNVQQPMPSFITPSPQSRVEASSNRARFLECPRCKTRILQSLVVARGVCRPDQTSQAGEDPRPGSMSSLYSSTIKCPVQQCEFIAGNIAHNGITARDKAREFFDKHASSKHGWPSARSTAYAREHMQTKRYQEVP